VWQYGCDDGTNCEPTKPIPHTPPYFFKINLHYIEHSPKFSWWHRPFTFSNYTLYFTNEECMLHARPIHLYLIIQMICYLVRLRRGSKYCPLHTALVHSRVLPFEWHVKFRTHMNQKIKLYGFVHFRLCVYIRKNKTNGPEWKSATVSGIYSVTNYFENAISKHYYRYQKM